MGDPARGDDGRGRPTGSHPGRGHRRPSTGCGRSNRARATASSSRSRVPATRWRARLQLQRAPLAPIRLRIGVHTGEVQLRDEANYIGSDHQPDRTPARSGARRPDRAVGHHRAIWFVDRLPADAWLTDLGTHQLRDLPRPERVVQLCHPDLRNEFPPLRTRETVVAPASSGAADEFRGREAEIDEVRRLLADNRLVTLTGAGGAARPVWRCRSRPRSPVEFGDGVWYVDLAPITDPDLVPVTVARALGLPDQPGRSTTDTLLRFIGDRQMLLVLDNCEHLLDARAALVVALLGACPALTVLATSREPIGVAGEVIWRVPSLSLADEAIELFTDRARQVRPDFAVTDDNAATVAEICRRLDGMPLAIELAAARVRALSLTEILDSLHDRFRLLTGGARTAVRRQQTLRASVDWSHALLTEPERVLFRRLAVFMGGFDLDAAQAVAGDGEVRALPGPRPAHPARRQVAGGRRRHQRPNAIPAAGDGAPVRAGEARRVRRGRRRPRTVTATTTRPWPPCWTARRRPATSGGSSRPKPRSTICGPHSRGAAKTPTSRRALQLASSLQPLWLSRGRIQEGLAWFDAVLTDAQRAPGRGDARGPRAGARRQGHARALVSRHRQHGARRASPGDRTRGRRPGRCWSGRSPPAVASPSIDAEVARPYFAEAIDLARAIGDKWRLEPDSALAGVRGDASRVTRSRRSRPATRDATSPTRSATGSSRACAVLGARLRHRRCSGELAGAAAQLRRVDRRGGGGSRPDLAGSSRPIHAGATRWRTRATPKGRAASRDSRRRAVARIRRLHGGPRLRAAGSRGARRGRCRGGRRREPRRPGERLSAHPDAAAT